MECPDGTWVAAFVSGEVLPDELLRFEAHLDSCENCLELVAEAATAAAASSSQSREESPQRDSLWVHLVGAFACVSDRWWTTDGGDPPRRERFGSYRVLSEIGRGAMGVVYAAVDERSSERAAVKTVTAPTARSLSALRHEIAFLRRARHPSIVRIFDDGVIEGDPRYAMELLEGGSLADLHRSVWPGQAATAGAVAPAAVAPPLRAAAGGRLDEMVTLFFGLCAPLAFVHRAGIVHCDLKPSNVLVRPDGSPVLVDFGLLSRADGALGRETLEVGGFRGTLPYLAPELIRGRIPDARADIYAVGCMLYESVTGRPPFLGPTARDVLRAHLYADVVPPSQLVSGLPAAFDGLVLSLLAKSPGDRVGSADVLAQMLETVLPVPSRRPSASPTPYLFRPRIVGRTADVDRVEALAHDAREGRGHFVLVGGVSGIGKTFLASEIARRRARENFEVVTGECAPFAPATDSGQQRSGAPFGPFRNLLQRAADLCRMGGPRVTAELFGGESTLRVLARYEPALEHLREITGETLFELPPPAERARALESMRELLGRFAARTPLLLVLDDLQWADDLSFALLASLGKEFLAGHAILILGLYRAEDASEVSALLAPNHFAKIELKRLDDGALTAMVGDMLSRPAPPELMEALALHSEGNPFFVAEYLRAAVTEGLLVYGAEGWRWVEGGAKPPLRAADAVGDMALPGSLRDLLAYRLQRLSDGARAVAEVASVLGREFRASTLSAVGETPATSIAPWIDEMIARQLVERVRGAELRFAHDKIRELAYARLSAPRRSALHFRAAEALERVGEGASGGPNFAEIAYHFRNGDAAARAAGYFEKAGEHAMKRSANEDAIRFFEEAIAATPDEAVTLGPTRHARWTRRIGDAYQGLGELSKSKARLLEALAKLGSPMPQSPREMGRGVAAKLGKQLLHRTVPLRWVEVEASRREAFLETARVYDRLTQIYYYLGDYDSLFFANLASLDRAERLPPSPTRAVGYTNVGATAGILGLPRVADLYFNLAESALKDAYDPEVESYLRVLWGHYLTGQGAWERALAAGSRVLELAERLMFGRRWEEGAGLRCNLAWGRDFDECLAWADRMFESAARRKDAHTTTWGFLRRAEVHAARGDLAAAERGLEAAEALVEGLGAPERVRALAIRAHWLLGRGRTDDALAVAAKAADAIAAMKAIDLLCVEACARVAEVRLAAWAQARSAAAPSAAVHARASCEAVARAARTFPAVMPRYGLHEGARLWLDGRAKAALALWEKSRRAAVALDLPYDEARLRLVLARHGPAADAASQAERARALRARLGVNLLPHEEAGLQPAA